MKACITSHGSQRKAQLPPFLHNRAGGRCITPRSPAGGFPEGERSSPSVLHFKALKGDGFLNTRA